MSRLDVFKEDFHWALRFDEARPELERTMYSYLGIFPLETADRPQTDGRKIFLQPKKREFRDDKDDLPNNRNMSLFLSDLIHELLHIREGSFLVDSRPYLEGFTNPGLAHAIFNIAEDARIENNAQAYLKPDDSELLQKSNEYLGTQRQFPEKPDDRFMEIYSSVMIAKGRPSQFNPGIRESEQETLETKIEEATLNSEGMHTISDAVERVVDISEQVYDKPVEATWEVVPQVYDVITRLFPNIERDFPTQYSPYAPVNAPQLGSGPKKKGKNGSKKGEEGKKEGESGGGGEEEKRKYQTAYVGFRGDVHDFSAGSNKGNKLEQLVKTSTLGGEKGKEAGKKPRKEGWSVGMTGQDSEDGKPGEGLVQIVTYDDIKKAYIHLAPLIMKTYQGSNPSFLGELDKHDAIRRRIVEHFEELRPNELQRIQFSEDPDELNMEALVEIMADPALRATAKVYDSHIINERDSLTAILMDISGSTHGRLGSGKRVIDIEKLSSGLIYQGLTEVGDDVLLYAFSTGQVTNLYRLSGLENLGALEPESANADGVAIRGVISELKRHEARDKTLYVISDGKPVASGYKSDPVVDTSMAFGEAEAQGIRTVYFNVDNQPSNYFDVLTRNTTFARSLRDVEQLPEAISDFVVEHG